MKAAWAALLMAGQGARFKKANGEVTLAGVPVHNYKPDTADWVVLFKPGTSTAAIDTFCERGCSFRGNPDEGGVPFAKVHGMEMQMESMLMAHPSETLLVEPDEMVYAIPDVEVQQTRATRSWGLQRIGAPSRGATGKGTHIYVQDTGIRTSHVDFGGRAVAAYDMSLNEGTECSGQASCGGDVQGHGSHCAGTAGGSTLGVAPDALIYAIKTLSDQGSGTSAWQYAGIDWTARKASLPAVLSMSLGGKGADPGYDLAFQTLGEAGITAVVAAGNSNSDTCGFSPAFSAFAITVGATDSNNKRASYSNWGKCNNIMAPGSAIVSVDAGFDTRTKASSGTSMACPHVAGAAALLLEKSTRLTPTQILAKLKADAVQNVISGLKTDDPNFFLWVSAEPADSPAPTPAPPPNADCPGYCTSQYCWWGDCRDNCNFC